MRRRLLDEARQTFPIKGSNWFKLPEPWTETDWRNAIALLDSEHAKLRDAVAGFDSRRLSEVPKGSKFTFCSLILGAAAHDLYHTGQTQLLKRLNGTETD